MSFYLKKTIDGHGGSGFGGAAGIALGGQGV